MNRVARTQGTRSTLRVVNGEGLLRRAEPARLASLEAVPTRPGEAPRSVVADLEAGAAVAVRLGARASGLPAGVWLRLAVEASRIRIEVAAALHLKMEEIMRCLNEAAGVAVGQLHVRGRINESSLQMYARSLVRSDCGRSHTIPHTGRIEIGVSERELSAWRSDAARSGVTLGEFIASGARDAPELCVSWEAAAAAEGRTVAEWAYRTVAASMQS